MPLRVDRQAAVLGVAPLPHAVEVLEREAERVDHVVVAARAAAAGQRVDALAVRLPGLERRDGRDVSPPAGPASRTARRGSA